MRKNINVNRVTLGAAIVLGAVLVYPMAKKKLKPMLLPTPDGDKNSWFAFVKDANGENIYEEPNESQPIVRLADNVYVGAITADAQNGFLPVMTKIDGKDYHFWIKKEKVVMVESQEKAREYRINTGIEKTAAVKRSIQRYFA